MILICSKFIVSTLVGLFLGCISIKNSDENPLTGVWLIVLLFTILGAFSVALMFVFGEQLPWSKFTLKEWLGCAMLAGYFIGGFITHWFEIN